LNQLGLVEHAPPASLTQNIVAEHQREMFSWRQQVDKTVRRQLQHFVALCNALLHQFLKFYCNMETADATGSS